METSWVILGRVLRVVPGPEDAEAAVDEQVWDQQEEHVVAVDEEVELVAAAAAEPAEPDITVPIALPPRVTILAAGRNAHPDPKNPDAYPYIIATGPVCLLAHFAAEPFYGAIFGAYDQYNHLVLVRHFQTTAQGQATASAQRIPSRPGGAPVLQNISNVVLASNSRGDYFIGELIFDEGVERAKLVYINSARNAWRGRNVRYPLAAANRRWVPHGTVFVDRTLWWFDLSWGVLSFDAVSQDAHCWS